MASTKEQILELLRLGELPVKEISERLGLKLTTASEAVRQLKSNNKVTTERKKLTEGKARRQTIVTLKGREVDIKISENVITAPEKLDQTPKVTVQLPKLSRETTVKPTENRIIRVLDFMEFLKTHNKGLWNRYKQPILEPTTGKKLRSGGKLANDFKNLVSAYNLYYIMTFG